MLILQIFLVPLFALSLLAAVFMVGVGGTTLPRQDDQEHPTRDQDNKYYPSGRLLPPL